MSNTKVSLKCEEALVIVTELSWLSTEKIPLWIKMRVGAAQRKISTELKEYNEQREELLKKHLADENGDIQDRIETEAGSGKYKANPKIKDWEKEMKPLNEERVEVSFEKIPLSAIKDITTEKPYNLIEKIIDMDWEPKTESEKKDSKVNGEEVLEKVQ